MEFNLELARLDAALYFLRLFVDVTGAPAIRNLYFAIYRPMNHTHSLSAFIASLREISSQETDEQRIVERVRPLAERLVVSDELRALPRTEPDPEQGFGFQLLHEEPDHTLVVAILSWLPGRSTPPHDHGTWGVVVGVEGEEVNTFWRRVDDGLRTEYAEIEKEHEKVFTAGESLTLLPRTIHSIENRSDAISVSLHIYGYHINHTDRSQFDTENGAVTPWKVKEG